MRFEVFQRKVRDLTVVIDKQKVSEDHRHLAIAALGLGGQTGELIEIYNKLFTIKSREYFIDAVGGCLCYVARACTALEIDMTLYEKITNFEITKTDLEISISIAAARISNQIKLIYVGVDSNSVDRTVLGELIYDYMALLQRIVDSVKITFHEAMHQGIRKLENKRNLSDRRK